jgi:hypothetical protein
MIFITIHDIEMLWGKVGMWGDPEGVWEEAVAHFHPHPDPPPSRGRECKPLFDE